MDSTINTEFIQRLKQKFNDCGIDFEQFCNLLIENNAFLSGSFLLQVIQNRFFNDINSDIDIYTFGNENKKLEKGIKHLLNNAIIKKTNSDNFNKEKILELDPFSTKNSKYVYFVAEDSDDDKPIKKESNNELSDDEYLENECSDEELFKWRAEQENTSPELPDIEDGNICDISDFSDEETRSIYIKPLTYSTKIINKYRGIVRCERREFEAKLYDWTRINQIVDFETGKNLLCKYQLIYFDNNMFKTPYDIVSSFDFDFCANYFDGKNIYIKNYPSIKTASCILNLSQARIYNNQNKRIIKYMDRGYNISVNYEGNIYQIIYESSSEPTVKDINPDIRNLIIICKNGETNINNIMKNLPPELERIIIYTYPHNTIIDNLPFGLHEVRLYIWNLGSGIEGQKETRPFERETDYLRYCKAYHMYIKNAINNIKKIPFDCNIYINDELLTF